jgi:hypothetical protein
MVSKKYKKIVNFGCSVSKLDENFEDSYGNLVSIKFDAHWHKEFEDITSNEKILGEVFNYFNNNDNLIDRTLAIIQLTSLNNKTVYYKYTDEPTTLYHLDFSKNPFNNERVNYPLYKYYDNYISHIYNIESEYDYMSKLIRLYTNFLKEKKIDVLWLPFEWKHNKHIDDCNFLLIEGDSIKEWSLKNNFVKYNEEDIPYLNKKGHKKLSEIIYQNII